MGDGSKGEGVAEGCGGELERALPEAVGYGVRGGLVAGDELAGEQEFDRDGPGQRLSGRVGDRDGVGPGRWILGVWSWPLSVARNLPAETRRPPVTGSGALDVVVAVVTVACLGGGVARLLPQPATVRDSTAARIATACGRPQGRGVRGDARLGIASPGGRGRGWRWRCAEVMVV